MGGVAVRKEVEQECSVEKMVTEKIWLDIPVE